MERTIYMIGTWFCLVCYIANSCSTRQYVGIYALANSQLPPSPLL
uniref:Uncharacterized protein n=1 Tax=Rhizophora mucronata TaxID=61149 RepID=A0A2P2Q696_RHIMU